MLGVQRPSLNKILNELECEGLVGVLSTVAVRTGQRRHRG